MSHRTIRLMLLACALVAPLVVLTAQARASVLFQDSFESPSTGSDGAVITSLPSQDAAWTEQTSGGSNIIDGLFDPNDHYYTGTDNSNIVTHGTITNMTGIQGAVVFSYSGGTAETFSHILTDTLVLGDTYDLSISVGLRNTGVPSLGYSMQLLANNIVLASVSDSGGPTVSADHFIRVSISHTAVGTDPIGQPLEIRFGTTQTAGPGNGATEFDAVQLDQLAPEPASASLLAAASLALLARRGRGARRKIHIIS